MHAVINLFGARLRRLFINAGKQHQKLFAAIAECQPAVVYGALYDGGHTFDDLIARFMTKAVIDAFEVVDVDHQAAYRLFIAHRLRHLGAQGIFQMMAVTQAGERIEEGFFQQGIAQTLVGQRQAERFSHQLQIGAGRGIFRSDVLEGEQPNGFALGNHRNAERRMRVRRRQMVAGDIRLAIHRRMALPTSDRPALIGMKRRILSWRRKPLRDAAHLPRIAVEDIEPPGNSRRDIGGEQLRYVNHVRKVFTPLQPLGHARQQLADGPVGVALFFQTLPRKAILTKDTNRLRHIANLIDLVEIGCFNRVILRRETVHHIAQAYHRAQHAAF